MTTLFSILLVALCLTLPTAALLALRYVLLRRSSQREATTLKTQLDSMHRDAGRADQLSKTQYDKNDMLVQAMRHSPLYVFVKEVTETTSRMLASSENYKQMPGRTSAGVTGRIMEEIFPPDFAAQTVANDRAALASDTAQTVEEQLDGRDYITTKFPIVSGGRRLLAGFTIDITDRKQAEAERELLMRAIEAANESIVITDSAGAILYVNPAFTAVTGFTRDEAIGQNPRVLKSGVHENAFFSELWRTISHGDPWDGQIVNKRKDGTIFTEQATISPVFDNAGKISNFLAVKRDITEQLRIAHDNTMLQEQLAQAQKMESVGRLAGGIAHDFNNMLQAIMGYADMAQSQLHDNCHVRDDIAEIQKAAKQAATLTRQLQTFARKDIAKTVAFDVNESIQELLAMLRRLIGSDVKLQWHPQESVGNVDMDIGQFNQIIVNLVVNARDAVGANGIITISTSLANVARHSHRELAPGTYICLSVHDNGSGIDSEIVGRIFDPFFTTKPVGQGTGLGLSVIYGIVKQAGGAIDVTSENGKGTLFKIYLPQSRKAGAAPVKETAGASLNSAKGEKLLLVDDEIAVLKMTQRILENAGYRVTIAATPQAALQEFESRADGIDMVISDVVMPGMSGPEMIKRMLAARPRLKYFFISGHTANLLENVGLDAGKINCLQKPFSAAALIQKTAECLNGND